MKEVEPAWEMALESRGVEIVEDLEVLLDKLISDETEGRNSDTEWRQFCQSVQLVVSSAHEGQVRKTETLDEFSGSRLAAGVQSLIDCRSSSAETLMLEQV